MAKCCNNCLYCNTSCGSVCDIRAMSIDDPYSDVCDNFIAKPSAEDAYLIGVDLSHQTLEDYRLCPDCQNSVSYDDMIWLNGKCTCPSCYAKRRRALDAEQARKENL